MWQSKNHMKVGGVDDFCPAFIHPDFLQYSLTVGTVTVAAGVVVYFRVPAVGTLAEVTAKFTGFAVSDSPCSLFLYIGEKAGLCRIGFISRIKYLPDLVTTHAVHPPCGQRD